VARLWLSAVPQGIVPAAIVQPALLRVAQDLIGFVDFLKPLEPPPRRRCFGPDDIRGQLAVRLVDLLRRRLARNA